MRHWNGIRGTASCVLALAVLVFSATRVPAQTQEPKAFTLDKYDSRISFAGGTEFITNRYVFRPAPIHHYWFERTVFHGGILDFLILDPGWGYGGGLVGVEWMISKFQNNPTPRKLGLTLTREMVTTHINRYGKFDFGFSSNDRGSCAVARQFLGESLDRAGGPSPGTEIVFLGYCIPRQESEPTAVKDFVLEVMDRLRADDGELNRAQGPDHPSEQTVQGRLEEIQRRLDQGKISASEADTERQRIIGGL